MDFQLLSSGQATNILAEIANSGLPLSVSVSEDICFADGQGGCKWVDVGKIMFRQGAEQPQMAIRFGAYEWQIPDKQELDGYIKEAISFDNDRQKEDLLDRVKKAFYQGFQDILRRLSLLLPTFDPDAVCRMPLRCDTTVVPDTSAVHQGALDFIARFLWPMARIRIPDVVHMEIDNRMDNYLSRIRWNRENRRKSQARVGALSNHLLSQGGQRTLLRLELHSNVELDRGDLRPDHARPIIQQSSDSVDRALHLTGIVKSLADRWIVETARSHRAQLRPDHPLILVTSDQGMARMAMAEGLDVFFFQSRNTPDPTGKVLTGTNFHPFKSELYTVPLTTVLWELAVSFGGARISNSQQTSCLELWALGGPEKLTWHPLHAKDDLIWGYYQKVLSEQKRTVSKVEPPKATNTEFAPKGYRFTPSKMLDLIGNLADKDSLTYGEVREFLSVKALRTSQRYVKFLQSGRLVTELDDRVQSTDDLKELWQAIRELNMPSIHRILAAVPSYSDFYASVRRARRLDADSEEIPISKYDLPKYIAIGEMAGAILSISGEEIIATDNDPDINSFASSAIDCYHEISRRADKWILTGAWLECLASLFAIHPIRARALLKESRERGVLSFYLEGSTPDTRYQKHTMTELVIVQGKPALRRVFLYQGDFISPGTAGVRIKIRMGQNNAT